MGLLLFLFSSSFFLLPSLEKRNFLQIMSSKPLSLNVFSSSLSLPAPAQKRDAALPRHVLCTALLAPTTNLPLPLLWPCRVTLHCNHRPLYLPGPSLQHLHRCRDGSDFCGARVPAVTLSSPFEGRCIICLSSVTWDHSSCLDFGRYLLGVQRCLGRTSRAFWDDGGNC